MKKSIRIIIASALLALSATTLSAQEKFVHLGVQAGLNFSTLDYTGFKENMGYQAGVVGQIDLPMWFSVQPAVLFHIKGVEDVNYDYNEGLGYLEVPINLQWGPKFYDDNIRIFVQGGPFLGYAISKDLKGAITDAKTKTRSEFDWDNVNRFETGAAVGLGVKLFAFQLTAEYTWNFDYVASDTAAKNFPEAFRDKRFSGFVVNLSILF